MQYLIAILVLAATLEYFRRERMHRQELAYLKTHRRTMPSVRALPSTLKVALRAGAAVLVLGIALLLVTETLSVQHPDMLLQALGLALLPVVVILAMMAQRALSENLTSSKRVGP